MKLRTALFLALGSVALSSTALAADPWEAKPESWSKDDVQLILNKSPWVQTIGVMPGSLKAKGDGTAAPPATTNQVLLYLRWYSSWTIRMGTFQGAKQAGGITDAQIADGTAPVTRFYILSLTSPDSLSWLDEAPLDDLAKNVTLTTDDGNTFPLVYVSRPKTQGGAEALFFFDRGKGIDAKAKSAKFHATLADSKLDASFDLTKMTVGGKRDLDGELSPPSATEKTRREVESAVLESGDEGLKRGISDVKIDQTGKKDPARPWRVMVFFDPARENGGAAGAVAPDAAGQEQSIATAVGKWSKARKSDGASVLLFVNPSAGSVTDFVMGVDAEKLAGMKADEAKKYFDAHLQHPKPAAPKGGGAASPAASPTAAGKTGK